MTYSTSLSFVSSFMNGDNSPNVTELVWWLNEIMCVELLTWRLAHSNHSGIWSHVAGDNEDDDDGISADQTTGCCRATPAFDGQAWALFLLSLSKPYRASQVQMKSASSRKPTWSLQPHWFHHIWAPSADGLHRLITNKLGSNNFSASQADNAFWRTGTPPLPLPSPQPESRVR